MTKTTTVTLLHLIGERAHLYPLAELTHAVILRDTKLRRDKPAENLTEGDNL